MVKHVHIVITKMLIKIDDVDKVKMLMLMQILPEPLPRCRSPPSPILTMMVIQVHFIRVRNSISVIRSPISKISRFARFENDEMVDEVVQLLLKDG